MKEHPLPLHTSLQARHTTEELLEEELIYPKSNLGVPGEKTLDKTAAPRAQCGAAERLSSSAATGQMPPQSSCPGHAGETGSGDSHPSWPAMRKQSSSHLSWSLHLTPKQGALSASSSSITGTLAGTPDMILAQSP